jgi:hypothetical protein
MRHAAVCAGLAVWIGLTAPVAAAPTVAIKARTELRLGPVRKDYGGYKVSGALVDRLTGAGIAGQRVTARIGGEAITVTTGPDGTFTASVPGPGGTQDVDVEFRGGAALDPVKTRIDDIDVDKAPVDLGMTLTPVDGGVQVTVRAEADGAPVPVSVEILAGAAGGDGDDDDDDGLKRVGTTAANGAPFLVKRKDAGGAGVKHLRARFAGDAVYAPATADGTVELRAATRTSFELDDTEVAFEDDVIGEGRVVDEDGTGVGGASIAVLAGDRRIGQATTRPDGRFDLQVEAEVLGTGRFGLQAVVEGTERWLGTSRSAPVVVAIAAPQPVPIAYTLAAFAATALAAAGFFAARWRPWRRWARPEEPAATRAEADPERPGGVALARPTFASALRRPHDTGVAGAVRDSVRGRPVAGARLDIVLGDDRRTVTTGDDGAFAVEDLPPGAWQVLVAAPGHVEERFSAAIPHRGELRGLRVDLVPVRERVFQLYRRAALPLLPDPGLWGIWSPRQIVDHVRGRRPTPALATLTDFVEDAYFGARPVSAGVLPEAAARVDAAIAEQGPLGPAASLER